MPIVQNRTTIEDYLRGRQVFGTTTGGWTEEFAMPSTTRPIPRFEIESDLGINSKPTAQSKLVELVGCTRVNDTVDNLLNVKLAGKQSKFDIIDDRTLIGIEVEVERISKQTSIMRLGREGYLWNNVADGSLRNNGREFVSAPIRGKNIPYAINLLCQTLKKSESCIGHEFSDRTSVHVHLDMQQSTVEQILNLILTYLMVESTLYKYVGGDRSKNIFCVPIIESTLSGSLRELLALYKAGDLNKAILSLRNWHKYTGFNLAPLFTKGTVEFRQMVGTSDSNKILTWINLLLSIKKWSHAQNFEQILDRFINMNTTSEYSHFIQDVFGSLAEEFRFIDLQEEMEIAVIFIKDLIIQDTLKQTDLVSTNEVRKDPFKFDFINNCVARGLLIKVDIKRMIANALANIAHYKEMKEALQLESIALNKIDTSNLDKRKLEYKDHTSMMSNNYRRMVDVVRSIKKYEELLEEIKNFKEGVSNEEDSNLVEDDNDF